MDIHAGEQVISGAQVFSERIWHEGAARPSLRVQLAGGLSEAQLEALKTQPWTLYDGGQQAGQHEGYNALARHELVLVKVASQEQLEQQAQQAQQQAQQAQQQAQQAQQAEQAVRAAVAEAVPEIADSAAAINALAPALPEWSPGAYSIGDVRMYGGAPYRCVQAHDSTANPGWTPAATPALWMQYHGATKDSARPWVQPTGAHDMYKAGEYMTWTDGAIYRCISDTNYSPAEYAQAWTLEE